MCLVQFTNRNLYVNSILGTTPTLIKLIGTIRILLRSWVSNDLALRFGQRLVEIDAEIAWAWGTLLGEVEKRGEKLPVVDSLIAVSANVHGLIVVTRNVQDIARYQAKVFNPWESQSDL